MLKTGLDFSSKMESKRGKAVVSVSNRVIGYSKPDEEKRVT